VPSQRPAKHSRHRLQVHTWVPPDTFTHPWASSHVPGIFLRYGPVLTHQTRSTPHNARQNKHQVFTLVSIPNVRTEQSCQDDWFCSIPFQQFQALLTLFSKSFSPFPHGTCLLLVPSSYLALDEIYHPLCAPIPRNVTLRKHTEHRGQQMRYRIITHNDALYQEAYICTAVGKASQGYNSRPETLISMPSTSLFIRHY
jgi:hypothetical protein